MIKIIKDNLYLAGLLVMIIIFVIIKIPFLDFPYYWDEGWVYGPAVRIMEANHLSILPNALPVYYSRGHPLLFHFLGALWLRIFGADVASSHVFALTVSVFLIFAVFYFCKKIFSEKTGLLACFLLMLQPMFMVQSVLVLPEIMLSLFSLMTIYFFLKEKWGAYIFAATCALFTKETGITPVISIGIIFLATSLSSGNKYSNINQFLLKSLILIIPVIIFFIFLLIQKSINGWFLFPEHVNYTISDPGEIVKNFFHRASCSFISEGKYLIFAATLIAVYFYFFYRKHKENPANFPVIVLLVYIFFSLIMLAVNFFTIRYAIGVIVPFVIMASYFIITVFTKKIIVFAFISLFCFLQLCVFLPKKESGDCSLGYTNDIKTSKNMVDFCVQNNFRNKKIYANFLMNTYLSNPYSGYISEQQKFYNINCIFDDEKELFIISNIELSDKYDLLKTSENFRLLKRFQSQQSWMEIYEKLDEIK